MIDFISNWAGELIVALIVTTIIEMLLPDNKTKKYVKTLIGLYIVFCIISPFVDKHEVLSIFENTEKTLEEKIIKNNVVKATNSETSIEKLYIEEFEKEVAKNVEELGYKVNKCKVNLIIDATKENAGINSIEINIGTNSKKKEDIIKQSVEIKNIEVNNIEKVEISINDEEKGKDTSIEIAKNKDIEKIKEFLVNRYSISKEKVKVTQN